MKKIGLITYHHPHLKTEQVLLNLLANEPDFRFHIFALTFSERKKRKTLISHRPDQENSILPEIMAQAHNIPYKICNNDRQISNDCDIYLVLGAGILSKECVENKKIINCHPGIIPACRGLDAFKWAIYEKKPLGITLHYIDKDVDAGKIISIIPTPIYKTDTIETLARRHYENEISVMSNFSKYLKKTINNYQKIAAGEPHKRMKLEDESQLKVLFEDYKKNFAIK